MTFTRLSRTENNGAALPLILKYFINYKLNRCAAYVKLAIHLRLPVHKILAICTNVIPECLELYYCLLVIPCCMNVLLR